ncbi:MAG TPA: hypothetical protein VG387_04795 [Rhizomicrobium sp.]|nr:hypothetical protein [Rhizomicrobium sp.]
MKLRADQKELAQQLLVGALLGAFVLAVVYGPPPSHRPMPAIFGVSLDTIGDVAFVELLVGLLLLQSVQVLTRHKLMKVGELLLGAALMFFMLLLNSGKHPVLLVLIAAGVAVQLFTVALVWLRDTQRGITT